MKPAGRSLPGSRGRRSASAC